MNVRLMFTGILSIIGLTISISALALAQNMLGNVTKELTELTPELKTQDNIITQTNQYCIKASDCKQDPKDCNTCVNLLKGGFTIISKCDDDPIPCQCIENACQIIS